MVVRAALPLIAEHGAAVTTAQIARAAGIGEATIFRAFEDKDAVLQACVAKASDPTTVLQELGAINLEQPLADRLLAAADALDAYLKQMGAVMGALRASGSPNQRPAKEQAGGGRRTTGRSTGRDRAQAHTRQAIAALFEPDRSRLRLPLELLADAYMRLVFSHSSGPDEVGRQDRRQFIDLLLHGAISRPDDS
jgi:AcrR family transcriptional regulator